MEGAAETVVAARIADRLGMEHLRFSPQATRLSEIAALVAWRTEGEITLRNALGTANHAAMKELGDFMTGGWLAECGNGQLLAPFMLRPASPSVFIDRCFARSLRYDRGVLEHIFSLEFLGRNAARLPELYKQSWTGLDAETNIDSYHAWYTTHRATRMTNASMPTDSHLFEKFRPFYDRHYFETAAGFPWRYRLGQVFYKALIWRLGPEIRDVPESAHGHLLFDGWKRNGINLLRQVASWAAARPKRLLRRATAYPAPSDGSVDPGALLRADPEIGRAIERFVDGPTFDQDIFNANGIRIILREHYELGIDHSELILLLAMVHRALDALVYCQTPMPTH